MSRSRRKTPVCGITTARSEKKDKRLVNRKLRRVTNEMLKGSQLEDDLIFPEKRDVSDVWLMEKDGKQWLDPNDPENRRALKK